MSPCIPPSSGGEQGGGVPAELASAFDAVTCAAAVQAEMANHVAGIRPDGVPFLTRRPD